MGYRKAWPEERVRTHITALAGTHLDPDIVAILYPTLGSDGNPSRIIPSRRDSDLG